MRMNEKINPPIIATEIVEVIIYTNTKEASKHSADKIANRNTAIEYFLCSAALICIQSDSSKPNTAITNSSMSYKNYALF
jgi:hypothetical protein